MDDFRGIEPATVVGKKVLRLRSAQSRNDPVAQDAALREAADGVEGEANNGFAIPQDIRNHGDQRHVVFGEADDRVRDVAFETDGEFADIDDLHR